MRPLYFVLFFVFWTVSRKKFSRANARGISGLRQGSEIITCIIIHAASSCHSTSPLFLIHKSNKMDKKAHRSDLQKNRKTRYVPFYDSLLVSCTPHDSATGCSGKLNCVFSHSWVLSTFEQLEFTSNLMLDPAIRDRFDCSTA